MNGLQRIMLKQDEQKARDELAGAQLTIQQLTDRLEQLELRNDELQGYLELAIGQRVTGKTLASLLGQGHGRHQ